MERAHAGPGLGALGACGGKKTRKLPASSPGHLAGQASPRRKEVSYSRAPRQEVDRNDKSFHLDVEQKTEDDFIWI